MAYAWKINEYKGEPRSYPPFRFEQTFPAADKNFLLPDPPQAKSFAHGGMVNKNFKNILKEFDHCFLIIIDLRALQFVAVIDVNRFQFAEEIIDGPAAFTMPVTRFFHTAKR